ncbi:MAG: hypothetical protein ABIO39_13695 [Caulobacteraceae bacterium]
MKRLGVQSTISLVAIASVVDAAPAAAPPADVKRPAANFFGEVLGKSLSAWKAESPPSPSPAALHFCSNDASANFGRLPPRTETERRVGTLRCTYLASAEPLSGPLQLSIGGGFRTRRVAYDFQGGSLYRVLVLAPGDAFNHLVARIRRRLGDPVRIERDKIVTQSGVALPHVRMEWRGSGSRVVLDDPTKRGDELLVTYTDERVATQGGAAT